MFGAHQHPAEFGDKRTPSRKADTSPYSISSSSGCGGRKATLFATAFCRNLVATPLKSISRGVGAPDASRQTFLRLSKTSLRHVALADVLGKSLRFVWLCSEWVGQLGASPAVGTRYRQATYASEYQIIVKDGLHTSSLGTSRMAVDPTGRGQRPIFVKSNIFFGAIIGYSNPHIVTRSSPG
ncbi:hypothetical protein PAXRUDRAFT_546752 [Paxillus rubicundulus Ve08.2h10]|uniref:Uncharacterized protein n=1 Tax=Paxillus rubicundulus Ve08.2h10 TaxID=930991 RepID=A0A0D0DUT0_9AGAM|nr:hypothetical protein PAXRUDRAFT_546752 [Paxillus rubicundulus Ve08.2h10]